jgi:hypothetical protein
MESKDGLSADCAIKLTEPYAKTLKTEDIMKQRKLAMLAAVLLLSAGSAVFAQGTDPLYEQLKAQFNARFGSRFELDVFVNVDSSLGRPLGIFNNYRIEDPYGTLAHSIIVTGVGKWEEGYRPPAFIGVYRGGQFLWSSDTLVYYYAISFNGMVQATDLNNDGKVEIILGMSGGSRSELEYLWIVTWDGQAGTIINDTEGDAIDGYESKIASLRDMFEFHDLNGDGVKEIIGEWYLNDGTEETGRVIYSWNGQKYGKWAGGPQFPPSGYLPRNKLTATMKAKVVKTPDAYRYQYVIQNSSTSQQEVNEVLVAARADSIRNGVGPERWEFFLHPRPKVGWVRMPFGRHYIPPGGSDSRFSYESTGLPAPVSCYVRGLNETLQKLPPYDEEKWYADVVQNSFVITTVGAVDAPSPFIADGFLDTLTIYVTESRTLGWITNQSMADKYLGYFSSAKTLLEQNNTTGARTTLQSVLRDVNVDSSSTLTSEAYALIRYNAEHLLDQLPTQSQEPPFVVQVDSLSARLATAYANGWIGDRALVKSLSGQLTDGRKNLGKGNLTRASTQLQNFLNRLQKVYHHTLEEQQKGKRRPKNFVTEGGFTFLADKTTELLTKLGSLGEILSVPGQFTTIQAAVNAAKPGTTIEVEAGTYKELVEIQKKDSLTLLASEDVSIQGVLIARSNVITVKGFTIDAAGTKKDGVEIEGQENTDITIEANEITNSSKDGISAGKHNVRTRIVNNVIAGNEKNGIDFADGTDGAQYVLNNTIVKNGWNGVEAASQKNLSLVNNIISFNGTAKGDAEGRYGVKRDGKAGAGKIVLLNNLIIGNNGKVNKQSSKDVGNHDQVLDGADSGNITSTGAEGAGVSGSSAQSFGDVLLADYRLAESSVAIDKGTVSFAAPDAEAGKLPEEDKDGNPRPLRVTIDLGAFELE